VYFLCVADTKQKKQKTTKQDFIPWYLQNGTAWNLVIDWLNLPELANCRATLLHIRSIIDSKGTVPWSELSTVMNANLQRLVWTAAQPEGVAKVIYRWFALHTYGFQPDEAKFIRPQLMPVPIITTTQRLALMKLVERTKDLTAGMFVFDEDTNSMAFVSRKFTITLGCQHIFNGVTKTGHSCCNPSLFDTEFAHESMSKGTVRAGCGALCGNFTDGGTTFLWTSDFLTKIDERSGLRIMSLQDGVVYPTCRNGRVYVKNNATGSTATELGERSTRDMKWKLSRVFDVQRLTWRDFKQPPPSH